MAKDKKPEEIEVNEEIVVAPIKKEKQKAIYVFDKELKTDNKTYKKGSDCLQTDETVIAYLLKNKIIKKK